MLSKQQALERMRTDIQLRGLSAKTEVKYIRFTEMFLDFCEHPIEEINEMHVRDFLRNLIVGKNLAAKTVNVYNAAIRFFFAVTLNRNMNYLQIPRMKESKTLPVILSKEEISILVNSCDNIKHKAFFLLAYGSGLRASEVVSLKVKDIDSKSMRVFVRSGKGDKDRYTLLSENALYALRDYWRRYRPQSHEGWLFPGSDNVGHISADTFGSALIRTLCRTPITKNVTPHTLRHCFSTHLLEDGYSLLQIKELLGHSSITSTTVYLHLANTTEKITSPADHISVGAY